MKLPDTTLSYPSGEPHPWARAGRSRGVSLGGVSMPVLGQEVAEGRTAMGVVVNCRSAAAR